MIDQEETGETIKLRVCLPKCPFYDECHVFKYVQHVIPYCKKVDNGYDVQDLMDR